ncbi:MAG: AMP-binding protein, partial [Hydrogenophaga sp.]|nr:AMP-binding protein [Hydrogenophaga sp.]
MGNGSSSCGSGARRPSSTPARASASAAIVDGEHRVSYGELAGLVERCAGRMAALGVGAGDRVALLLDNRIDFVVGMLATARLGAIVIPMNVRQRLPETEYALNDCGAKLLVHESSLSDQVPTQTQSPTLAHRILVDDDNHIWDGDWPAPPPQPTIDEDSAYCILYTSGTTGRPKGAVLTHFGVVTNCMGAQQTLGLGDDECTVLAVPASHVTGVLIILLAMVRAAGKSVMMRGFKARRFLEIAEAERMTYDLMVPAMYTLCLMDETFDQRDLSAWRVGAYGGSPMPAALAEDLARRLPHLSLMNVYGAT